MDFESIEFLLGLPGGYGDKCTVFVTLVSLNLVVDYGCKTQGMKEGVHPTNSSQDDPDVEVSDWMDSDLVWLSDTPYS